MRTWVVVMIVAMTASVAMTSCGGGGLEKLYADVIDAIQTGRAPYVDGEAGKRALELVLAIYKSAAEHRPVKLPLESCSTMDFVGRFDEEK